MCKLLVLAADKNYWGRLRRRVDRMEQLQRLRRPLRLPSLPLAQLPPNLQLPHGPKRNTPLKHRISFSFFFKTQLHWNGNTNINQSVCLCVHVYIRIWKAACAFNQATVRSKATATSSVVAIPTGDIQSTGRLHRRKGNDGPQNVKSKQDRRTKHNPRFPID